MPWTSDLLVNVNFPALPVERITGIRAGRQGRRDESVGLVDGHDPSGRPYVWIGDWASNVTQETDTDLAAVAGGAIVVTPLHLDLTHGDSLSRLQDIFG